MDIGNTLPENNSEFTPEKLLPQKEGSHSSNHPFAESLFVLGSVWDFVFFGRGRERRRLLRFFLLSFSRIADGADHDSRGSLHMLTLF